MELLKRLAVDILAWDLEKEDTAPLEIIPATIQCRVLRDIVGMTREHNRTTAWDQILPSLDDYTVPTSTGEE